MTEELEPFIDPKHVSYEESGTPGYKVPVHKAVLSLRPKTTIAWHADVPPNTTVEVDAHIPRLDAFWEIIKELVEKDDAASYETRGRKPCCFCDGVNEWASNFHHESTCVLAKARRLAWEIESIEHENTHS